jgi:hypothetical protein
MLGGRRESVTVATGHLQDLGALRYSRGHISIINRRLLEQRACECYGVVRSAEFIESRNLRSTQMPEPADSKRPSIVLSWLKSSGRTK